MKKLSSCGILLLIVLLGFPSRADAYLDPGTGSMVLQVVAGGLLAAIGATKVFWHRIKSVFRGKADVER
jgi:hypothetical protein